MEKKLYYSPEEDIEDSILQKLIDVVNTYSKIYNNPQYGAEEILKGIETSPDKINALIASINSIGIKKELDLDEAKRRYEGYKSDKFNIKSYVAKCVEENDRDSLLSFLGAEALRLSEFYKEQHQYRDPPVKVADEWETRKNAISESLEGTPFGQMIDSDIYSDLSNTLEGLEQLSNIEQLQDAQLQDSQLQNPQNADRQLQTTLQEGVVRNLLAKGAQALKDMQVFFKGNKDFEGEVMNPAQKQLGIIVQGMNWTEDQVEGDVEGFLAEIEALGEDALKGLEQFFEEGLEGIVSDLRANILDGQDLEELSQAFLEAKESGNTKQMAKLSGKIIWIAAEQEPQRYKDMTEAEMCNYKLSDALAAYDVGEYTQRRELKISDRELRAMQIALREKYLQNNFSVNQQITEDRFSEIKDDYMYMADKADALRAFRFSIVETQHKEEAVRTGEHSNIELVKIFASISEEWDRKEADENEAFPTNNYYGLYDAQDYMRRHITERYEKACENGDNVPGIPS